MEIKNTPESELDRIFHAQRQFFESRKTYSYQHRIDVLNRLRKLLKEYDGEILAALKTDFDKPAFESYASEIGVVLEEIDLKLKNLKQWMKPRKVRTALTNWPSKSYVRYEPRGICLVISPWNYPLQLALAPTIAALAAGNTVIVKPSEKTPAVARLLEKMLNQNFDDHLLQVVQGEGKEVIPYLVKNHRFDYLFFTGSTTVGRKIAEMAASQLTPHTLELGGKSPVVVDESANLRVTAKRIAFAKFLNAGQTCVAPDYMLLHEAVYDEFLGIFKETLDDFYAKKPLASEDLASIVNLEQFKKLIPYLNDGKVIYGGEHDEEHLRFSPTILTNVSLDSSVMKNEIFGPILPVLKFNTIADIKKVIARNPYPLALYVFSKDKSVQEELSENTQFGGGMINSAVLHLSNPRLPFGGIGTSGYGKYHGKSGFLTFSHQKSIVKAATWFDPAQKYPPYGKFAFKMIRRLMR